MTSAVPTYRIESFEGPLDLLLFLISKHKLDIYDIPICELVDQYLDYVRLMRESDMDIASDFLAMAARLVLMKSAALLPVYDDTADKMKRELTGELIDYRDCKKAASMLGSASGGFDSFVREPADMAGTSPYTRKYETAKILAAYISAVGRRKGKLPPPLDAFRGIVSTKIVLVASKFRTVIDFLGSPGRHSLDSLYHTSASRSDLVALFLSLLELARNKNIRVDGERGLEKVTLLSSEIRGLKYEE